MARTSKKLILNWLNYNSIKYDTHIDQIGTGIILREKDVNRVYEYISCKNDKAVKCKLMDNLFIVYYNLKKGGIINGKKTAEGSSN